MHNHNDGVATHNGSAHRSQVKQTILCSTCSRYRTNVDVALLTFHPNAFEAECLIALGTDVHIFAKNII
jgi:hypothetical protein